MLFIRFDFVNRLSFIFLGGLSIMFGSAGSLSNIMEHVGSIINSSNTICRGRSIKLLDGTPRMDDANVDKAIGIGIVKI